MSKIWFVKKKLEDFYYGIRNGIPNLIIWFPVIWRDRNWDHFYIWNILHKKLSLMEDLIRNRGHHLYREKDADQIKLCINLLDRLIKDEYHEMVFKNHDKKWGQSHFNFSPLNDGSECSRLEITYDNVITDKDEEQQTKELRRLSLKVEEQKKQDIDFLFDYMKKHIQGWWD